MQDFTMGVAKCIRAAPKGAERVRAGGAHATRPPKADGSRTGGPGGVLNPPAPPEAKNS